MHEVISGGLAEAAAESGELDTTGQSLLNVRPYCGEHFRLWVMSALKVNLPGGGASRGWSCLDPGHVVREPGLSVRAQRSWMGKGRDSPVPSHTCCPRTRTLLSRWKRCW